LTQLQEAGAQEEQAIVAMETDVKGIEAQISGLNTKQADIREEIGELKSLNNSLKDGITARALQLDESTSAKKRAQGQIVSSPEKFRNSIIDVGHSLQTEMRDSKAAEKKLRELAGWLTYVEEAQYHVADGLERMRDVRSEVERQKAVSSELDEAKQTTSSIRDNLHAIEQNVQTVTRQSVRAAEKLQHLQKQAKSKTAENRATIDGLHAQILQSEQDKAAVKMQCERSENDVVRVEREHVAFKQQQQAEVEDMQTTYRRLETTVVGHLQKMQQTLAQAVVDQNSSNNSSSAAMSPPPLPAAMVL